MTSGGDPDSGNDTYLQLPGFDSHPTVGSALDDLRAAVELERAVWAFADGTVARKVTVQARGKRNLTSLIKRATHPNPAERVKVIKLKSCPPELLTIIAEDDDPYVRSEVITSPKCPIEIRQALATDPNPVVRKTVAAEKHTPVWMLKDLAEDPRGEVRRAVAGNPNTPAEVINGLVGDPAKIVRRRVAANPLCAPAAIERLTAESDDNKWAAARNPVTPPDLLRQWAQQDPPLSKIRSMIARNPSSPPDLVTWLIAAEGSDGDHETLEALARRPDLPINEVQALAGSSARNVIAGRSDVPQETLAALAKDPDPVVRVEVLRNRLTPRALVESLCQDEDDRVRTTAALRLEVTSPPSG